MFKGGKCSKCQKDSETWYTAGVVSVKNTNDWMPEVNKYDKKQWIGKFFCLDCWKSEEKNYRESSWDTFKWRIEKDQSKREKLTQLTFIGKFYPIEEKLTRVRSIVWNQSTKKWNFVKNGNCSDLTFVSKFDANHPLPILEEKFDRDSINYSSNNSSSFSYGLTIFIIFLVILAIGAVIYFLAKKKKKR